MNGKSRCKILKEIRRQIAEQNDIEFITSECKHKGDCAGTCPKCESEVRYLEKELKKREMLGKTVVVAGLALAVTVSAVGCAPKSGASNDNTPVESTEENRLSGPNLAALLLLTDEYRNEYISKYTRDQILSSWEEYRNYGSDSYDSFYITYENTKYSVYVYYDDGENDKKAKSISVSDYEDDIDGYYDWSDDISGAPVW